jgi:glycosyltransferase involved in cell wall biosynthesis
MKIGIICFWDRHATPYLAKYEQVLRNNDIDFEVIFWNRSGKGAVAKRENELDINLISPLGNFRKMLTFLIWRRKIIKILKDKKYDYLIVLSTYPAVLLSRYLFKQYKGKFIFDIRDYSLESFLPFKWVVMKLINSSSFSTISSKGFMRWLNPSEKIIINHNITYIDIGYNRVSFFQNKNKVNITFVGNVRLDTQTRFMLFNMRYSNKYSFGFVGRMLAECDLDEFCVKENITNVFKKGPFVENDKPEIYKHVDVINAVYANEEVNLRLADSTPLPNRVYDAAIFKCPIVASRGTFLAELITEYNIGFAVNGFDTSIENEFNKYINEFNEETFVNGCNRFLADVMKEENYFRQSLINTVSIWKNNNLSKYDFI